MVILRNGGMAKCHEGIAFIKYMKKDQLPFVATCFHTLVLQLATASCFHRQGNSLIETITSSSITISISFSQQKTAVSHQWIRNLLLPSKRSFFPMREHAEQWDSEIMLNSSSCDTVQEAA